MKVTPPLDGAHADALAGPASTVASQIADAAVTDHEAASDPHPQYATDTDLANAGVVALVFVLDGGGAPIAADTRVVELMVPFAATITEWDVTEAGGLACTIALDVTKRAYGGGAPASITGSEQPGIGGGAEAHSTSLTGWTTAIAAGAKLYVDVISNDIAERITLTITAQRA